MVPYSRLHDVGGAFGGNRYVDIPNLFRNFDADPYDPASYDFTFTDRLITNLVERGIEPFFRLGVTIENFNEMWRGTKEQYYELYGVVSKYLKERFPHLKIGGYGAYVK